MATLLGLPAWLLLHVIVAVIRVAAALPFAAVAIPPEVAPVVGLVAGVAVLAAPRVIRAIRRRRSRRVRGTVPAPARGAPRTGRSSAAGRGPSLPERLALVVAALLVALSTLAVGDAALRTTRLVMLDIGQGDAILLEAADGARLLVDGGPDPDRLLLQLDARIPPWDRRIDIIVLSHPHEDHVAGLVRVLERYRVGRVFEPGMHGPGPGWAAWDEALRGVRPAARSPPVRACGSATSAWTSSGPRPASSVSLRPPAAGSTTPRSCCSARRPAGGSS